MEQIKKLASDIDLDEVQKLNPSAYNNYMSNLQKQNENIRKMDEYADFVNRERDRINREQLNMANVNNLNQLNVKFVCPWPPDYLMLAIFVLWGKLIFPFYFIVKTA